MNIKFKTSILVLITITMFSIFSLTASAGCNIEPPNSPVKATVIGWSFEIMDFYSDEMEKCGDVNNIDVKVQLQDFAATKAAFRLAMAGGKKSPYDIMHVADTGITEFGNLGWFLPLNDLIDKYRDQYDLDDISAAGWQAATIDGKIYGIPATANTLHLAYRSDLLSKHGIKVPTNYDEMISACKILKKNESSIDVPFTLDLSAGWAWEIEFLAFIRAFGGDFLNSDLTPGFNSPAGIAAATKMKEVVDGCMGPEGLAIGYEAAEVAMNTGAQAMVHIWASNTSSMFDPKQSQFSDVIKFAPAAAPKVGGKLGGSSWHDFYSIPSTTANDHDLLFRILMESLDKESQFKAADFGIVTRKSIKKGLPNLPAASKTIANGIGIYNPHPATHLARTALGNWMPFIGNGEKTPKEALDAAAAEYIKEATAQGYLK